MYCAWVTQSCPTLCDPMECSLPGSSVHGDSPGKSTGVGCHALLQVIFPTQGSNPGLPHCCQILYCLSHQGNPDVIIVLILPLMCWVAPCMSYGLVLSKTGHTKHFAKYPVQKHSVSAGWLCGRSVDSHWPPSSSMCRVIFQGLYVHCVINSENTENVQGKQHQTHFTGAEAET